MLSLITKTLYKNSFLLSYPLESITPSGCGICLIIINKWLKSVAEYGFFILGSSVAYFAHKLYCNLERSRMKQYHKTNQTNLTFFFNWLHQLYYFNIVNYQFYSDKHKFKKELEK